MVTAQQTSLARVHWNHGSHSDSRLEHAGDEADEHGLA